MLYLLETPSFSVLHCISRPRDFLRRLVIYEELFHPQPRAMGISNLTQEIRTILARLASDRDQLQTALTYAHSTISELEAQNRELDLLLSKAQAHLQASPQGRSSKIPWQTSWICGTWLSSPKATPFLTPVESAWQHGQVQEALKLLSLILLQQDITNSQRVEAGLLFSAMMRSSGNAGQALVHAEKSLSIAKEAQLYDLVGKAQFHLGLCYFYEEKYADARWCFVRASHTPGHNEMVAVNREMAEQRMSELPSDDQRRTLSPHLL
jgi:tetratricopeptide (TPR) repeat protein